MAFGRFGSVGAGFGRGGPAGASGYPPHNLVIASKDASTVDQSFGVTVTVNTTAGPLGDVTADTCAFTPNSYHYKATNINAIVGRAYCGRIWIRAAAPTQIGVRINDGAVGSVLLAIVSTAWQPFVVTMVSTTAANPMFLGLDPRTLTGDNNLSKTVFAADWQVNYGTVPTAYVAT